MSETASSHVELITPRMRLRRLRRADAALVALYCGNAELARMTASIPHPYPPGLAESFVARAASGSVEKQIWGLDTGDDAMNGLIGVVSLRRHGDGTAAIGYWVAPAFWGAGYATEAVEAVVAHARAEGLRALVAQAFQDNLPGIAVLRRVGFVCEGEGQHHSLARGTSVPTYRYRLDLDGA